jgi:hypothetical protein
LPVEGARGWVIKKEKQAHKIDPLIALAMAALAAVERKNVAGPIHGYAFGSSPWEALYELVGERGPREDIPSHDVGFACRDGSPLPRPVSDLNENLLRGKI